MLLVLGVCYFARGPILRSAAWFLVAEDPPEATTCVLPLEGGVCHAQAIRLCQEGWAAHVVLVPRRRGLAQELAKLPGEKEEVRGMLDRGDQSTTTILVIPCDSESDWDRARCLADWLSQHPDETVTALCGRLRSARWRYVLRSVLPAEAMARVRLRAVRDPDYDETNWWHDKHGTLDFLNSFLGYAHIVVCGEDRENKPEWNPDQYEKSLK